MTAIAVPLTDVDARSSLLASMRSWLFVTMLFVVLSFGGCAGIAIPAVMGQEVVANVDTTQP